jgi:hypothetical protein
LWPVARIEQGIEILTGMPAGSPNGSNKFDAGTVFARIDDRLSEMARTMKSFE